MRLEDLADLAERIGHKARWAWTTRSHRHEQEGAYMPGWCNGSAGFVHLWTLAHRIFGNADYLILAERAAVDSWECDGSVGNLCCGYAGQAYAMLNLYKHTSEPKWLYRAQAQAQKAALAQGRIGEMEAAGLRPESLYKGELGIAVLAADLTRPEFAAMPFFEGEGWYR
jgi:serine/threonine-protein kinase